MILFVCLIAFSIVGLTKSDSDIEWIFKSNLFKYFGLIKRQYDITLFQLFYLKNR